MNNADEIQKLILDYDQTIEKQNKEIVRLKKELDIKNSELGIEIVKEFKKYPTAIPFIMEKQKEIDDLKFTIKFNQEQFMVYKSVNNAQAKDALNSLDVIKSTIDGIIMTTHQFKSHCEIIRKGLEK